MFSKRDCKMLVGVNSSGLALLKNSRSLAESACARALQIAVYFASVIFSLLFPVFVLNMRLPHWLILLFAGAAFNSPALAQAPASGPAPKSKPAVTTVYLVRHAEKDPASDPADPGLTAVGEVRAQALSRLLVRRRPAALFTTDTKRTRATLAPLAAATGLEPQVYDAKATTALAVRIRQEYLGKAVVVVGHSNTLLPLITSLGGTPPVEEIGDQDYDYLFTVHIAAGALPTVAVQGYGPERPIGAPIKRAQAH
jgi:phosphohistidine phosphatase SixA